MALRRSDERGKFYRTILLLGAIFAREAAMPSHAELEQKPAAISKLFLAASLPRNKIAQTSLILKYKKARLEAELIAFQ